MTLIATKACFSAVSDVPPRLQRVDATGRLTANRNRRTQPDRHALSGGRRQDPDAADLWRPPRSRAHQHGRRADCGGDRLRWEIAAGSDTSISITTQACEKLYKAGISEARIDCRLDVAAGASLAWLPQETIVYDGSGLSRRVEADLAPVSASAYPRGDACLAERHRAKASAGRSFAIAGAFASTDAWSMQKISHWKAMSMRSSAATQRGVARPRSRRCCWLILTRSGISTLRRRITRQ
jgi:hypothetical protein